MKKVFLSMVLAAAAFTANAQLKFIPKVGVSIASLASDPKDDNAKVKVGFQLGAALEIGVTDMFAVQPELLFIQKGGKSESGGGTASVGLNYLEIPILAKVKFGSEAVQFHVNAGPSLGIALSGKSKLEGGGLSLENDVKFGSEKSEVKRTDFGVQFGGGISFSNFVIDLRYGLGLSNLSNDSSGSIKNRAIGITIGYAIPLGGK